MKKTFCFIAFAFPLSLMAQTDKWSYGFQGSFGLSTVTNVYDSRLNSPSFGGGVQIMYKLNDHWQSGASLQFSRDRYKGNAISSPISLIPGMFETDALNFTQTETADMRRLLLQLRYNWLSPVTKIRPYTYLGGSLGYRSIGSLDAVLRGNDAYTREVFSSFDVMTPHYSRIDYGLIAGAGLSWQIGQGRLITTELFYYHGLKEQSDIISYFMDKEYTHLKQRQQNLRVQVGFLVPF